MDKIPPLRITATYYDSFWDRQHFKGHTSKRHYCEVDGKIHTFYGEPECPIREDVDIIEVTSRGEYVKHWQHAMIETSQPGGN